MTPAPLLARAALLLALAAGGAMAQEAREPSGTIRAVSTHLGEMAMSVEAAASGLEVDDALRFEPYQQLEEMFLRDDVVFLMRHGPTDWSRLDDKGVAPDDCAGQRVMIEEGMRAMRDLGTLMAANDILPARIVTSQWCRNQQTVEGLLEGIALVDAAAAEAMPVETDPELNLLLSLQGARETETLRERVSSWEGDPERPGPLLLVSHYTNIEELTQFRVFEGEILVIDPKRDNLVLGYLRLRSAEPDVGHFADALASPLLDEARAFEMVDRYYEALNDGDAGRLGAVLSERWVVHGDSPSEPIQDAEGFLAQVVELTQGLDGGRFEIEAMHFAGDAITVRGTITGRHTGTLLGVPATGRDVAFGAMAVHRIEDGTIAETWQMADWAALMALIGGPG